MVYTRDSDHGSICLPSNKMIRPTEMSCNERNCRKEAFENSSFNETRVIGMISFSCH